MRKSLGQAPEHPARVWEAHRLLFTKSYRDNNKKLEDVQRILNGDYKFYATNFLLYTRQYKRKIKDWHLEKNSKAADKKHALDKLESLNIDLDTRFTYKSEEKDIASHKIRRFAKSQGTRHQGSNENPREFSLSGILGNQISATYDALAREHLSHIYIPQGTVTSGMLPPSIQRTSTYDMELCQTMSWGFLSKSVRDLESLASVQCDQVTLSIPIRAFLQWGKAVLRALNFGITPISSLMLYIHRLKSDIISDTSHG
ncbi:hypothetical protein BS50DRAFT_656248 [Corynespora cassiicola Philippines]|uniref:Clr5 domain-containing protein n=1 Tax=Corynespora cassiicola Philippines TaxID=1448308 RepID=A0A2T2N3M5_CORCC|nr:hypothetical protein BS50DRAFT_656248 [Corynespora cassiicola Philippines]